MFYDFFCNNSFFGGNFHKIDACGQVENINCDFRLSDFRYRIAGIGNNTVAPQVVGMDVVHAVGAGGFVGNAQRHHTIVAVMAKDFFKIPCFAAE